MRIGIEAQRIFRPKKHGMDMVALELIRNLQQLDTKNEYIVFVRPDEDRSVLKETPNFRIVELEARSFPEWEQHVLPRAARKYGCDLLHCTSNTAPIKCSVPLVITLHDIIYMETSALGLLRGKGTRYQKFGNVYRRMVVPRVVRKARQIITVSDFERKRIREFFGMTTDQGLVTVYNGAGKYFKPVTDACELQQVKEKYNLPDEFAFFLGNTDPKKNTAGTLRAFAQYIRKTGSDLKLVMIDYEESALQKLLSEIGAPELRERIYLTGYIANTDLPAIYSQCRMVLYPSLRESFGIPIIEAMASGAPVITSDTSSMPEVAGDAALLIDPFNPDTITEAMIRLEQKPALRKEMIQKGLSRAEQFSWRSMAVSVLKLYHETHQDSYAVEHSAEPSFSI